MFCVHTPQNQHRSHFGSRYPSRADAASQAFCPGLRCRLKTTTLDPNPLVLNQEDHEKEDCGMGWWSRLPARRRTASE